MPQWMSFLEMNLSRPFPECGRPVCTMDEEYTYSPPTRHSTLLDGSDSQGTGTPLCVPALGYLHGTAALNNPLQERGWYDLSSAATFQGRKSPAGAIGFPYPIFILLPVLHNLVEVCYRQNDFTACVLFPADRLNRGSLWRQIMCRPLGGVSGVVPTQGVPWLPVAIDLSELRNS